MTITVPTVETTQPLRLLHGAIFGSIVVNVVSLGSLLLPGQDEIPTVAKISAVAFAVIAVIGAIGLWHRRRWGAHLTVAATVLNMLGAVPGLADPPSGAIALVIAICAVIGFAVIVSLYRPALRRALA